MSKKLENLKVGLDEELEEKLQWLMPSYSSHRILRKSVDARKRHDLHFVYSLEVFEDGETPTHPWEKVKKVNYTGQAPLIIGAGPAGLFAALRFVEAGVPCHLFERGSECSQRMKSIARYWRYGELNPNNNVCYGEGGAGLYSDGKLITRIKSPHIPYVLQRLVQFGAPEEILFLANPHVGSDKIRRVIPKIRNYLLENGCKIHFDTQVTELVQKEQKVIGLKTQNNGEFYSDHTILAVGHSAEDMMLHLRDIGVKLEGKSFAMGLRIEHPQELINSIQYRQHADHPKLGAANYKLARTENNIGVYSFCMCPGGYVLSSGTDPWGLVCNGMSNYNRNSPFANAAVVVSVDHQSNFGDDLLGGLELRKDIERKALEAVKSKGADKQLPAQRVVDFFENKASGELASSSPSGVVSTRLDQVLPKELQEPMQKALQHFERSMPGFMNEKAVFHGVESRTSSPLRISRDKETLVSTSHAGLYPCGEGAGYAGGITSAACDGIRIADQIIKSETGVADLTELVRVEEIQRSMQA